MKCCVCVCPTLIKLEWFVIFSVFFCSLHGFTCSIEIHWELFRRFSDKTHKIKSNIAIQLNRDSSNKMFVCGLSEKQQTIDILAIVCPARTGFI